MPKRNHEAAALESAVRSLFIYIEDLESKDEMVRDEVRDLVHKVNEAYLNWAIELDNVQIRVVS
jgi:hypothetical protein